jgi:ATP-binding cassette subfamily B protein
VLLANAPIGVLLGLWDQVQQGAVLLQRLQDVLEAEPEQRRDETTPRHVHGLSGRITLSQVRLAYPDAPDRRALDDVSLVLDPGSTLGLVGRSGSGKSTLVRCLAGLVVPNSGSVLYDEVDMRELDWRQLRRRIGVVLQAPYLFDNTIAANIALGEDLPDPVLVQRAAEIADAAGFIEALPLGYETKVGDSGMRLSGGQAQRICIARALYHDPPVLLFDEATSALDTESEATVKRNLDRVLEQRTAVIVAHRLTTIRDADTIAVLEQGRVVEHGTHDELLAREGLYHHLHASQIA